MLLSKHLLEMGHAEANAAGSEKKSTGVAKSSPQSYKWPLSLVLPLEFPLLEAFLRVWGSVSLLFKGFFDSISAFVDVAPAAFGFSAPYTRGICCCFLQA